MKLRREDVYICNVVKCRPPGNRNPEPDEVAACEPFLVRQLQAIAPQVIVALGKFAAQTLIRSKTPITQLRGRWFDYHGIMIMPTFHPAYLLRNPGDKRLVWEDIQKVMRVLGLPIAGAIGLAFFPRAATGAVKVFGLAVSLATFVISLGVLRTWDDAKAGFQFVESMDWIPQWGIRYARGIENRFMRLMHGGEREVPAYPVQNRLTPPLRAAAAQADDPQLFSLWADD